MWLIREHVTTRNTWDTGRTWPRKGEQTWLCKRENVQRFVRENMSVRGSHRQKEFVRERMCHHAQERNNMHNLGKESEHDQAQSWATGSTWLWEWEEVSKKQLIRAQPHMKRECKYNHESEQAREKDNTWQTEITCDYTWERESECGCMWRRGKAGEQVQPGTELIEREHTKVRGNTWSHDRVYDLTKRACDHSRECRKNVWLPTRERERTCMTV